MAKSNQLIQNFRGGIISPLMAANADAERFKQSLSRGENYMILPDGSALMRPGSEYKIDAKDNTRPKRLETFQWTIDFLLEFGDLYVRIYDVTDMSLNNEFVTPWAGLDLQLMKYAQKNETMVLVHPDHAPQTLVYSRNLGTFIFQPGVFSFIPQHDFADNLSPAPTDTINDLDFTSLGNNSTYKTQYGGALSEADQFWDNTTPATNETRIRNSLKSLPTISSTTTVTVADQGADVYRVTISGPSAGKGLIEAIPTTDNGPITTTVIQAGGGSEEDAWSATRGWPTSATFFEQRLIFGGAKSIPDGFWGSDVQDYANFEPGVFDHESYFFRLDTREPTEIFWVETASGFLALGTRNGIYQARGDGGAMTPTSFLVSRQTTYRCNLAQGKAVASELLFVEAGGHKVRNLIFSDERKTQLSYDLSFMVSHLTADSVSEINFMEFPEKWVFIATGDGRLLQCAYSIENDLLAWTEFTSDGVLVDVTLVTTAGGVAGEALFALVEREGELFIESLNMNIYEVSTDEQGQNQYGWADLPYLDSHVRYQGVSTVTITGLDHLEGRTVSIIVNGAVHPDKDVSGGQVILDWAGTDVIVGLPYENELSTVQQAYGNQAGTALGTKRRWNRAFLNVVSSIRPEVNGVSVADRTPATPMDTPEPLVAEEIEYRLRHWNKGVITIKNPYNLACCVTAVYGESSVERQ